MTNRPQRSNTSGDKASGKNPTQNNASGTTTSGNEAVENKPEGNKADFQRGWDAALQAVRSWHEAKAKQAMVQSTRTRFPKNLERDAELHRRCAQLILTLSPDDV